MKHLSCSLFATLVLAGTIRLVAANESATDLDVLKRELRELRARTEQLEEKLRHYEQAGKSLPATNSPPPSPTVVTNSTPASVASSPEPVKPWSPSDPVRLLGNKNNYLNLSLDGLFAAGSSSAKDIDALQPGGHDPKQRGFTVQNLEAVFEGMVDPYLRAQASLVYQIDSGGSSTFEVEEAYAETLSLPGNFQLRGGQFFTEFGRLNATHPHTWDFADQPLVNGRMFGADGLRNAGARVSWLAPTPFYSELFFTLQNSHGGTASSFRNENDGNPLYGRPPQLGRVRQFTDMLLVPRYAASFDLTDSQTLLVGASAAFGPNSTGTGTDTQIYGADLFWKWKPATQSGGFPFLAWQSEAMLRKYEAGAFAEDLNGNGVIDPGEPDINGDGLPQILPRETLTDYGFYTQLVYGFRKGWTTGLRYDYTARSGLGEYEKMFGADPARDRRWRISPNLTWYPSEFSKVRLQYNLDDRDRIGTDHSVWLQLEFLLGAHAAHKF
jgi:hypothetical protein